MRIHDIKLCTDRLRAEVEPEVHGAFRKKQEFRFNFSKHMLAGVVLAAALVAAHLAGACMMWCSCTRWH